MDSWALAFLAGSLGVVATGALLLNVRRCAGGTPEMQAIGTAIRAGAMAYLKAQYLRLGVFAAIVFALLLMAYGTSAAWAFLLGVATSGVAGFTGIMSATWANVCTTQAARSGDFRAAFNTAFYGGAPLGIAVASLGLIGICGIFLVIGRDYGAIHVLWAFSLGASTMALFARVGGGIYTKAADIGADLVGKLEMGIPEDDPRNPGVIADNVGDNVGDVAGMGADLYESYVGSIVAATTIAASLAPAAEIAAGAAPITYPVLLATLGLGASLIGIMSVRFYSRLSGYATVAVAELSTQGLFLAAAAGATMMLGYDAVLLVPVLIGDATGFLIGRASTYYTSSAPVREIVRASSSGPATNVITGIAVGFESCAVPLVILALAVIAAHAAAGIFGVALAGVGLLATVGMTVAIDSSGPIADNAGGIAEMAALGDSVRAITDDLDALGNSTAANGKGFAIGSAALTALGLFFAFKQVVAAKETTLSLDITDPGIIAGAFIGASIVVVVGSLTLRAVGAAATRMVEEIRRQFQEIPGLLEGKAQPQIVHCITISTDAALNRMLVPTLIALIAPLVVGYVLGPVALAGMLLGGMLVGVVLAIFMANAGGAWDNAKKMIERGLIEGAHKGDAIHAAAVIGDTVGDPFKDTTGPSMNILIKLQSIVALMIAPLLL